MCIDSTPRLSTEEEVAQKVDQMSVKEYVVQEYIIFLIVKISYKENTLWLIITYVYPIISPRAISFIPEFLKNNECKT
jgi:hypothetical protein